MKRLYCRITLLFLTVNLYNALAQECAQAIRLARAIYDQGRLQEVETYLKPCFTGNSATDQKTLLVEAYKLLCLSHIYLEEPEKADEDMLNIKRTDPYYRPNEGVDPAEYVALYKTFRENPVFRYGARIGINASRPNIRSLNTAVQLDEGSSVKQGLAFYFGLSADIPLKSRLTLHNNILFNPYRFNITENVRVYDPLTDQERRNQFRGTENQTWLTIGSQAEYALFPTASNFSQKLSPYVAGGGSLGYLLNADMTAERLREGQSAVPEANIDIYRTRMNVGLTAAAGIKPKVGTGKLVIEIRFTYGITPVNTQDKAYKNERLLMDYYYVDPIFTMNSLSFSVAYMQDKFAPKKLTRSTK